MLQLASPHSANNILVLPGSNVTRRSDNTPSNPCKNGSYVPPTNRSLDPELKTQQMKATAVYLRALNHELAACREDQTDMKHHIES